jgi:hypothetical protein
LQLTKLFDGEFDTLRGREREGERKKGVNRRERARERYFGHVLVHEMSFTQYRS